MHPLLKKILDPPLLLSLVLEKIKKIKFNSHARVISLLTGKRVIRDFIKLTYLR